MGFSSNLRDAREAAGKLGADLKALHPGQAREEYEKVLERSRSLLTQIEQVRVHIILPVRVAVYLGHLYSGWVVVGMHRH